MAVGTPQHWRVEDVEQRLLQAGDDLGADASEEVPLVDHHRLAGLADAAEQRLVVEGAQAAQVESREQQWRKDQAATAAEVAKAWQAQNNHWQR